MEKCFDAFVYVANRGTYQLMLRLPRQLRTPETLAPYCTGDWVTVHGVADAVILEFLYNDEAGEADKRLGWITDEQAESWLSGLLPLHAELASGDVRCLYLGRPLGAECGMPENALIGPPDLAEAFDTRQ